MGPDAADAASRGKSRRGVSSRFTLMGTRGALELALGVDINFSRYGH